MTDASHHALVFGATGLVGWAVVDQLLASSAAPFASVTAVSNRPVTAADARWPSSAAGLRLVSGVDLRDDALADQLRREVDDIARVTHVFYFVFAPHNDDHLQECRLNCDMMRRVVGALNTLAPRLKSFVYSGGTRGYGIYAPDGTFTAPLKESMADNLPADYAKTVAYPWFRSILTEASAGRAWSWSEVCPDVVVGFSPIGSNFSLALHWAQYLSLYARNHGAPGKSNIEVPFPGNEQAYRALFTPVSSRTLGRIAIHAALNPDACGGKIINMVDRAEPSTFAQLWPAIADWFGLVGVGPADEAGAPAPGVYVEEHKHVFGDEGRPKAVGAGVGAGHKQLDSVGWWLTFDRQLSADRLRGLGFVEERSPAEGWLEAFEKLRAAGIIF